MKVLLAINTFAQAGEEARWRAAVDEAAALAVDAVILADFGLLDYASQRHPQLRLHLSVQGSASNYEAINLAQRMFGVQRAVLPRVLSLEQVAQVIAGTTVEIEVFGFGSLCVMAEGRCHLSSYATGESPQYPRCMFAARHVRWLPHANGTEARLNGVLIDDFAHDEPRGYPTLCKGAFTWATAWLRAGRAYQPQRAAFVAKANRHGRSGHQGRRAATQPSLRGAGNAHAAPGAGRGTPVWLAAASRADAATGPGFRRTTSDTGGVQQTKEVSRHTALPLQLAIDPLLYFWPRDEVMRFYADAAEWLWTAFIWVRWCARAASN